MEGAEQHEKNSKCYYKRYMSFTFCRRAYLSVNYVLKHKRRSDMMSLLHFCERRQ